MEKVGTTKLTAVKDIEEIKGSCPNCGGALEFRVFVDAWDAEGNPSPSDIFKDPYCPKCDIRWMAQPGPHDFFEG